MIAHRLVDLRNAVQLSQAAVAALVDISTIQYARYEDGRAEPSSDILVKLARILKTTTDYLLGVSDENYAPILNVVKELRQLATELQQANDFHQAASERFLEAVEQREQTGTEWNAIAPEAMEQALAACEAIERRVITLALELAEARK